MKNDTDILPFRQSDSITDPLTELAREGARRMLAEALKAEADAFVASFAGSAPGRGVGGRARSLWLSAARGRSGGHRVFS